VTNSKNKQIDYVLGDWDEAEKQHFRTIRMASEIINLLEPPD
jgi:hypothetical protein